MMCLAALFVFPALSFLSGMPPFISYRHVRRIGKEWFESKWERSHPRSLQTRHRRSSPEIDQPSKNAEDELTKDAKNAEDEGGGSGSSRTPDTAASLENDDAIDVVFTWGGASPSVAKMQQIKKVCTRGHSADMKRFRDTRTLRPSMSSILVNMPWVRKIWLVTLGGERPCWLDGYNGDRVHVVAHADVWPKNLTAHMPSYNSVAIEVHLHRITGLSERFIYFNDDLIVLRPLSPSYFFTDDGKLVVASRRNFSASDYAKRLSPDKPCAFNGEHSAVAARRSMIERVQKKYSSHYERKSAMRCRTTMKNSKPPFYEYNWFALSNELAVVADHKVEFSFEPFQSIDKENGKSWAEFYQKILRNQKKSEHERADILVMQDDFPEQADQEMADLARFLQELSEPWEDELRKQAGTGVWSECTRSESPEKG